MSLTGTLSGYLLRILVDSMHRCSDGKEKMNIQLIKAMTSQAPYASVICHLTPTELSCIKKCSRGKIVVFLNKHNIRSQREIIIFAHEYP